MTIKLATFEIKDEKLPPGVQSKQVVQGEPPVESTVQEYEFQKLKPVGPTGYAANKAKYGALSAVDPDRHSNSRKDSRFLLNPLLREPLSIEDEEKRIIEEKVRSRIEAMAEEAKEKAAAIGYQDGLKKGFDEAFQKFREEGAVRLKQLTEFMDSVENAKREIFRANERFLIDLVFQIARNVLLKDLKQDRDYIIRLSKELIERVGLRENIRIKISSEDAQSVGLLKDELDKAMGGLKNLNIEVSESVKLGGCQIESQWNAIDASVENQLNSIKESLLGEVTEIQKEA